MKRLIPVVACVAGLALLVVLFRWLEPFQPHDVRITRDEALTIADRAAAGVGIRVQNSWRVVSWIGSDILDQQYASDPDLRRRANTDPVIAPRLGAYRVVYFHKGLEKVPNYGDVLVSATTGEVIGVRRRARAEARGGSLPEAQVRTLADNFIASSKLPGAETAEFESARPTVQRGRTDWLLRYKVTPQTPTGHVNVFIGVYFIGEQFAGWMPLEEYRDGSAYRSEASEIGGFIVHYVTILVLLLWALVLFLKKYHAGEVGVRTGSVLFAMSALIAIAHNWYISPATSVGAQFGSGLDGVGTAIAMGVFRFLFYDLQIALLVFGAWSVGESYARERWGDKLASYDALLHRDAFNATVGRSLLNGVLLAPAIAASALLVAWIPVSLGIATPSATIGNIYLLGLGGPLATLLFSAYQALLTSIVAILFVLAFFKRRKLLWPGVAAAIAIGTLVSNLDMPLAQPVYARLFGFGAVAVAVFVFLAWDLLTTATSMFFAGLILTFGSFLGDSTGVPFSTAATTAAIPLVATLVVGIAGLWTRRSVEYTYEDLAPHVKRIVERERVKAEIDAANRIQAALLPLDTPNLAGASVASHYRAATEIGGDYFDFLPQPTGEIGIAFGDVSGHGLTSGIVMAMAKSALLVQVTHDPAPRAVMNVLNDIVIKTAPKRIMMTFFFGLLDPASQTLRFSSAGHHDPYVYRAATGKLEALSSWGFPLGVRRRDPFREHTVAFSTGDKLILYSDGLIEAVDDNGEPFGFDRFEKTLIENGTASADEIKKALLSTVRKFTHNRPPEDDQTLVVVSFDELPASRGVVAQNVVVEVSETVH